jgi:hypothetical protein
MQATFDVRRSQFSMFIAALALLAAVTLGVAGGYLFKSLATQSSATVAVPAVPAAIVPSRVIPWDQPERSTAPVTSSIDPVTGETYGSAEDQRILKLLKQSGYEGGATVASSGGHPSGARRAHQLD